MIIFSSKSGEPFFAMKITTVWVDDKEVIGTGVHHEGDKDPVFLYYANSRYQAGSAARLIIEHLLDTSQRFPDPIWLNSREKGIQQLVDDMFKTNNEEL